MHRTFELRAAERRWLEGGSALPVVKLLRYSDARAQAAAVARLALSRTGCPDAAGLEAELAQLAALPAGYEQALKDFASNPSSESWRELMRFVPTEYAYQRLRETVRRLSALGVNGDALFSCAAPGGLIPELIELVEQGRVSVRELTAHAASGTGARATFLGLAAQAALLTGDMLGTVRLLRASIACENDWTVALPHIMFIREHASADERQLLDRAGIPSA
jgi:hypothetical protein